MFDVKIKIFDIKNNITPRKYRNSRNVNGNNLDQYTKHLKPLVECVLKDKNEKFKARDIDYSISVSPNEKSFTHKYTINIKKIRNGKRVNNYKLFLLGKMENIKLCVGNKGIQPTENKYFGLSQENIYEYTFDLSDIKNMEYVTIEYSFNSDKKNELFFYPRNYVQEIDNIKINSDTEKIKCNLYNGNYYEEVAYYKMKDVGRSFDNKNDVDFLNSIYCVFESLNNKK